ncbi:MAG: hypothetical protein AMR96_00515 [Candidatus Adiutrix intracellularis]|nr:MAG: hypothetical protein AMR96_00515 [Candidatus Adiutrix intracellularis]
MIDLKAPNLNLAPVLSSPHFGSGQSDRFLVIRPVGGLAGDIIVAGLLSLAEATPADLEQFLDDLNLGALAGRVTLIERWVKQIGGVSLAVDLPEEFEHRNLKDIEDFFAATRLTEVARAMAIGTFRLLAEVEGSVHGLAPSEIHFHEVGALDSLLDIGLAALLVNRLAISRIICGPLPLCDGVIKCWHGWLPSPAPAVLKLLTGVLVIGRAGFGETVTPTALALLKSLGAEFGPWPLMLVEHQTLVYGTKIFDEAPNGTIFALGRAYDSGFVSPIGEIHP